MVESEYAKALYELAIEEKKEDVYEDSFKYVLEAYKNEDFVKIMTSPFIDLSKQKELINNVFSKLDETFINFLYVLIDHRRFSIIKGIFEEYSNLVLLGKNIVNVVVKSANTLTNEQIIQLKHSLEKRYANKEILIKNIVDQSLIGGIQIIANGKSIDISVKNSLNKLKEIL